MKAPLRGAFGPYFHATDLYFNTINMLYDYGVPLSEIAMKNFGIPPIKYLVEEVIPYKDIYNKREGWFYIKGITIPIICCDEESRIANPYLIGFLENKKFLGIKKEILGCKSCPCCGEYVTYPKELIDVILEDAGENEVYEIKNKLIDETLKKERIKLSESEFKKMVNNEEDK